MPLHPIATIWLCRCVTALAVLMSMACDGKSEKTLSSTAAESDSARIERGRLLVERYQCGACHTIDGVAQARGIAGPSLDQFGRRSYIAGQIPNTEVLLAKWIVDPHDLIATTIMPSMGVTQDDAHHMAIYLRSLR